MEKLSSILLQAAGSLMLAGFGFIAITSLRENERRAARVAFALALAGFPLLFASMFPLPVRLSLLAILCLGGAVFLLSGLLPVGRVAVQEEVPASRVDERDIMFARARLVPGTPEYRSYYAMRPGNQARDEQFRSRPGLLSPDSQQADPFLFASARAGSDLTERLREIVDGPVAERVRLLPPDQMTAFAKNLARYYGALDVGVAELHPYHVYSHVGRGTGRYGEPIHLEHRFALAFTVEMNFAMIAANPAAPGIMESIRQYVEAARVAVQLAGALRHLGHAARAHIDGNYRVIAPLVARDAGLGEIGRMGLLMTPRLGPRVRLGVVTTTAELVPDNPTRDASVVDFCSVCRKCAENCPSRSIPFGAREEIRGALRWQINAETCYRYWCSAGTDCGLCMTVCPYSHPDTLSHNLVRRAIRCSGSWRRAAYWADNLFYGRKPVPRGAPDWTKVFWKQ